MLSKIKFRFGVLVLVSIIAGISCSNIIEDGYKRPKSARYGIAGGHDWDRFLVEPSDPELDRVLGDLEELGVGWVRLYFVWPYLEPKPGELNFEIMDQLLDRFVERGFKVMASFQGAPWFNKASDCPPEDEVAFCVPIYLQDPDGGPYGRSFEASLKDIVGHFAGRVSAWEIYEETNTFWHPRATEDNLGTNAAAFAKILAVAYQTIKEVDDGAVVVSGSLACPGDDPGIHECRVYADAFLGALGGRQAFDAFGVHPGHLGVAPWEPWPWSESRLTQEELMRDVKRVLYTRGYGDRPVWVTNIAWATNGEPEFVVTEQEQAEYLTYAMGMLQGLGFVEKVFWMELQDTVPPPDPDPDWPLYDYYLGLERPDSSRKPSFEAYRAAIEELGE